MKQLIIGVLMLTSFSAFSQNVVIFQNGNLQPQQIITDSLKQRVDSCSTAIQNGGGGGGSLTRFGIEDTTFTKSGTRYFNLKEHTGNFNSNNYIYYDFDGDSLQKNYLQIASNGNKYFDLYYDARLPYNNGYSYGSFVEFFAQNNSSDNPSIGESSGFVDSLLDGTQGSTFRVSKKTKDSVFTVKTISTYVNQLDLSLKEVNQDFKILPLGVILDELNNHSTGLSINTGLYPTEALDVVGNAKVTGTISTGGYTVATLPTGIIGMMAYVTDATTPTYLSIVVAGGAIFCPVIFDGTNWISH